MSAQWPEFDLDRTSFADILSLFEVNLLDSETQSTKATGDKLEMATAELWGACGDVFRFAGSRQTYAGQIDGVVEVHTSDPVLRDWGSLVIYECKNWTDPAGLPELAVLLYKMQLTDAKVDDVLDSWDHEGSWRPPKWRGCGVVCPLASQPVHTLF